MLSPGGTFALYSLLCRHAKLSLLPNQQAADEELSAYKSTDTATSSPFKRIFEKHKRLRTVLLLLVLAAAAMVIGNGVLTPAISGKVFLYFTFGVGAGAVILHFFQLKPPSPRLVLFIFSILWTETINGSYAFLQFCLPCQVCKLQRRNRLTVYNAYCFHHVLVSIV